MSPCRMSGTNEHADGIWPSVEDGERVVSSRKKEMYEKRPASWIKTEYAKSAPAF